MPDVSEQANERTNERGLELHVLGESAHDLDRDGDVQIARPADIEQHIELCDTRRMSTHCATPQVPAIKLARAYRVLLREQLALEGGRRVRWHRDLDLLLPGLAFGHVLGELTLEDGLAGLVRTAVSLG